MFSDTKHRLPGIDRRTTLKGLLATGIGAALFGESAGANVDDGVVYSGHEPLRSQRFLVEIDGIVTAGFTRVLLPDATVEEIDYREGTDPPRPRKLAGISRQDTLVLENGVSESSIELFEWFQSVRQGRVEESRRDAAVVLLDQEGNPAARWEFRNAWPIRYDGPDLDALASPGRSRDGGIGALAIETIELTHEGMERVQ